MTIDIKWGNEEKIANDRLPNEGYFTMIGVGSFVRSIVAISIRIIPAIEQQYAVAESMEEALEIVARGRSGEDHAQK